MAVIILKWIVVVLSAMNFGYMVFDGGRALIKGDYLRPTTGEYEGQLGPWTKIVNSIGIDPESSFMKFVFIFWGLMGIAITICFASNVEWAWKGLLIINVCSLWYLWMGTASSVIQIILLSLNRLLK